AVGGGVDCDDDEVVDQDGGGVGCAAIATAYEGGHKVGMVMASVFYDGVVVGDDDEGSGGGCIEMMTVIRMVSAVGSSRGSNGVGPRWRRVAVKVTMVLVGRGDESSADGWCGVPEILAGKLFRPSKIALAAIAYLMS
ncbi:hypothetical protein Tco_0176882, partial [Tanacetum coccineum]